MIDPTLVCTLECGCINGVLLKSGMPNKHITKFYADAAKAGHSVRVMECADFRKMPFFCSDEHKDAWQVRVDAAKAAREAKSEALDGGAA